MIHSTCTWRYCLYTQRKLYGWKETDEVHTRVNRLTPCDDVDPRRGGAVTWFLTRGAPLVMDTTAGWVAAMQWPRVKFKVKSVLLIGLNTGKCFNYLNLFLSNSCLGITYVTNFYGYLFSRWNLTRYLPAILIQRPVFIPSYRNRRIFPVIFQKCTIIVFVDSYSLKKWIQSLNTEYSNEIQNPSIHAAGSYSELCGILFYCIFVFAIYCSE